MPTSAPQLSAWNAHLAKFRATHPKLTLKECMQQASKTYRSKTTTHPTLSQKSIKLKTYRSSENAPEVAAPKRTANPETLSFATKVNLWLRPKNYFSGGSHYDTTTIDGKIVTFLASNGLAEHVPGSKTQFKVIEKTFDLSINGKNVWHKSIPWKELPLDRAKVNREIWFAIDAKKELF